MHKHHGRHSDPTHHAHILMYGSRGHHKDGGTTLGNMPKNTSHYKRGGNTHRRLHAEGGMTGINPVTGERSPDVIAKRKGGRACHAEGDIVAKPYRRGGGTHQRRSHHWFGQSVVNKIGSGLHDAGNAIGNAAKDVGSDIKNTAENFGNRFTDPHFGFGATSKFSGGGNTHRRRRHAEGDMAGVNPVTGKRSPDVVAKRKGGRACHGWGDFVHGVKNAGNSFVHGVEDVGRGVKNAAENFATNTKRFFDPRDAYNPLSFNSAERDPRNHIATYRRGGKTHQHRQHHGWGDFVHGLEKAGRGAVGAMTAPVKGAYKAVKTGWAEGDTVEAMRRGGHKKKSIEREHHKHGNIVGDIADTLLSLAPLLALKEGGPTKKSNGGIRRKREHHMDGDSSGMAKRQQMYHDEYKKNANAYMQDPNYKRNGSYQDYKDSVDTISDKTYKSLYSNPEYTNTLPEESRNYQDHQNAVNNMRQRRSSSPYMTPYTTGATSQKLAAGGSGKVRKGMLSKNGKIINSYRPH